MPGTSPRGTGLRRSLSVWQAIGLSIALMAPSMAANINPQASAATAGRAVPLAFLIAAVGVLLVAYTFVRLCQYYHHSGSVYAFVGATLGPRAGVVAGWGLLGTYTFYAVVTSSAAGIFGTAFLNAVGVWPHPPSWAPFLLAGVALALTLLLAIVPARRGTNVLLSVEGATVALILYRHRHRAGPRCSRGPRRAATASRCRCSSLPPGTSFSPLFLGVVFGFLSFAGFEAAATLGEEATHPTRDIPRAILGTGHLRRDLLRRGHRGGDDGLRHGQGRRHAPSPVPRRCWATSALATSGRGSATSSPWAPPSAPSAAAWRPRWARPG